MRKSAGLSLMSAGSHHKKGGEMVSEHEECGQGDEFSDGMDWADDLLDYDDRSDDNDYD